MIFELTMANLISLAGLFLGFWALLKVIALQAEKRSNEKLAALQAAIATVGVDMRGVRRRRRASSKPRSCAFQAELPRDYVRRDDFVQVIGSISTRIDNFALRVERALDNRNGGKLRNDHQLFRRSAQSAP